MKFTKTISILALSLFATVVLAEHHEEKEMMEKPSFSASQTATVTAVVTAIDHETRVVTVRRTDGEEITFTAR